MRKRVVFSVAGVVLAAASCSASSITAVTTSTGQPYTVTTGNYTVNGNAMVGISISATFNSLAGLVNCGTWTPSGGSGPAGCSSAGNFSVQFSPGNNDTDIAAGGSGAWIITNLNNTYSLATVTINALAGGFNFDRCYTGNGTTISFNDSNPSNCIGRNQGTTGSNIGYSAEGVSGSGTTSATATAQYQDLLHTSTQTLYDIWGQLVLTFTDGTNGTSAFTSNQTFYFRADTDHIINTFTADIPEPGSLGLIGAGLLVLGVYRTRRKRGS